MVTLSWKRLIKNISYCCLQRLVCVVSLAKRLYFDSEGLLCPLPGLSGGGLDLVDPGLVYIHGVGAYVQVLVVDDVFDHRCQQLPERVLTTCSSVEAHYHLDDGWVSGHNVLDLINLRTDTRGQGCTLNTHREFQTRTALTSRGMMMMTTEASDLT